MLNSKRIILPVFTTLFIMILTVSCDKSSDQSSPFKPVGSGERPEGTLPDTNDLFLEAVRQGQLSKVQEFLKSGEATIDARDGLGSSALLLAVRKTDQLQLVRYLYEGDPKALNAGDNRDRTPLSWAAHFNRPPIATYLLAQGANVDQPDRGGNTPLSFAAMRNSLGVAKLLLQKGAQVNHRNKLCDTPLMFAAAKGNAALVRLLIQNGADSGYQDQEGRTATDRLQHLDAGTKQTIEALLKTAPRSAMNPECEK